jgi:hypothetical protein
MTLEHLDNLVKIQKLKAEPPDQHDFDGMLKSARIRLQDSQFSLAYGAAHALALAALRWHGYRSDNRYLVFQCLQHTVGLTNAKWRVLDLCHKQRNQAQYEGHLEVTPQLLKELIEVTKELLELVEALALIN